MRTRITACPKVLQCVAVSTTISPVQLTAEADVNRASTKAVDWPGELAWGIQSKKVPNNIRAAKAATKTMKKGGFLGKYSSKGEGSCGCFFFEVTPFNSVDVFFEERLGDVGLLSPFSFVGVRLFDLGVEFSFRYNVLWLLLCQCKGVSLSLPGR